MTTSPKPHVGPLPNFLVCGAAKSGTTSLYNYLAAHPDVFMSEPKEPNFFNRRYENGLEWYADRYFSKHEGQSAVGEASPSTMQYAEITAPRIAESIPDAKLIFLLRNPIERLYSDYYFSLQQGIIPDSQSDTFSAFIRGNTQISPIWLHYNDQAERAIDTGKYVNKLREFDRHFDTLKILILLTEDLHADKESALRRAYKFIGVDTTFLPTTEERSNKGRYPRSTAAHSLAHRLWHALKNLLPDSAQSSVQPLLTSLKTRFLLTEERPTMSQEDHAYLCEMYASQIYELENRLGRDLSHWMSHDPK